MNKKTKWAFAAVVLILTGCKSLPPRAEIIDVNGMIYDTSNRPVVNYSFYVDGKLSCTSDIGGRFVIKKIAKGEHDFYGKGAGYLDINDRIQISDKAQILYIRVPSVESKLKEAFELMKKGELGKAEGLVNEVLQSDSGNQDALYFIYALEKLKGAE